MAMWIGSVFWLNGEKDPDPAKTEQYGRWRKLRKLQEENERKALKRKPCYATAELRRRRQESATELIADRERHRLATAGRRKAGTKYAHGSRKISQRRQK